MSRATYHNTRSAALPRWPSPVARDARGASRKSDFYFAGVHFTSVKGFWSLTMYDPQHFFYANDLNRYSLGTKSYKTLKFDADGGLTLYLGNKSPGTDKEANWILAPASEFSLWLRAYWPEQALLDGSWKPPAIRKMQ